LRHATITHIRATALPVSFENAIVSRLWFAHEWTDQAVQEVDYPERVAGGPRRPRRDRVVFDLERVEARETPVGKPG
jgi:hypothetical protein